MLSEEFVEQFMLGYFITRGVQSVLAVGGNLLTIYSIATFSFLQTPTNAFVFNLAVCDLLVGIVGTPLSILAHFSRRATYVPVFVPQAMGCNSTNTTCIPSNDIGIVNGTDMPFTELRLLPTWKQICFCKEFITLCITTTGQFAIVFLTVDRFLYIKRPFQYLNVVTTKRAGIACAIAGVIIVAFLSAVLPFSFSIVDPRNDCDSTIWTPTFAYGYAAPVVLTLTFANIVMYAQIALVAFKQSKNVQPVLGVRRGSEQTEEERKAQKQVAHKQSKVTKMIGKFSLSKSFVCLWAQTGPDFPCGETRF